MQIIDAIIFMFTNSVIQVLYSYTLTKHYIVLVAKEKIRIQLAKKYRGYVIN